MTQTKLSAFIQSYIQLGRFHKPIGTILLFLPCAWGLALAGAQNWVWYLWFGLGALAMRAAGCVINDMSDYRLDAQVERTRTRPIASGQVALWQAGLFALALLLTGAAVLAQFPLKVVFWGIAILPFVFLYPWSKRWIWTPQLVLGVVFNWGVVLGWLAVQPDTAPAMWWLYASAIFWTLGYDTIYAMQDKKDDVKVGVKSTALLFGDKVVVAVAVFYALHLACLVLALPALWWSLPALALPLIWQLWRTQTSENYWQVFTSNGYYGALLWAILFAFVGAN